MPAYESLAAAMEAQEAYIAAQSAWVRAWMDWMAFAFLSAVWFAPRHKEARWALVVAVASVLLSVVVGYLFGWSRLWGAVHILVWTPYVVYFARRRPHLRTRAGFAVWGNLLLATMIVSLAFDLYDLARFAGLNM